MRRDELGDPGLCADAPDEDGQRCDHCPLDRLDAAQTTEKGLVLRRALDLMSALKLAVHVGLDEIRGDEFCAMLIIAEERDLLERGKVAGLPRAARRGPDALYRIASARARNACTSRP